MKVCSFAFAFLLWSARGSADTGVYEAECASPNIFVDQNTGETYCYRVARYNSEDFLVNRQKDDAERLVAKNICEKKTQLTFGGEHRSATIVTINSALENEFVFNILKGEFSKLSESEHSLTIRRVLLGRLRWQQDPRHPSVWGQWDDLSDSCYFLYRFSDIEHDRTAFAYMLLDTGEWVSDSRSLQKSDFDNGKFGFVVCKARFKTSTANLMAAPMDNRVYECDIPHVHRGNDEVICFKYVTVVRPLLIPLAERLDLFVKLCDRINLQITESVVVQSNALTLNDAEEVDVFREKVPTLDRALLAFTDGAYLGGSDAEYLKKTLNFSKNSGTICGAAFSFMQSDVRPVNCVDEDASRTTEAFYCKGRYPLISSSVSTTAEVSNFVYDCVHASKLSVEISGHSEVFCYNVTAIAEKDVLDKEKYTDLASRCEFTNFSHEGEVKPGVLTSLNLAKEARFVREVLTMRFLERLSKQKRRKFSDKFMLGLQKDGWLDGSDAALLRDKLPGYGGIQNNTCGFLNVKSGEWTIGKCTCDPNVYYHLVVCKARFEKRLLHPSQSSSRCGGTWTCGVIAAIWMAWMAG